MKKLLILLAVLALVIGGGYYWWINYRPAPAEENSNPPASGETSGNETPAGQTTDVTVTSKEYSFSPNAITVKKGVTVRLTFKNEGNVSHNFLIDDLDVNSGLVSPGSSKTFEFTVSSAGTYSFYCSVPGHKDSGMVGTLKVE